jgi:hypothetical protein
MEWGLEQPPRAPDPARVARARAEMIEFCESEYPRVVRFLMLAGAPEEVAEKGAREAFADWWAVLGAEPGRRWEENGNRSAWVRATALRSRALRPAGVRTRPSAAGGTGAGMPGAAGPGGLAVHQELLQALRGLDEEPRRVMAFIADGFTTAEVALALFLTEQKVQAARDAAGLRLRQAMAGSQAAGAGSGAGPPGGGEELGQYLRAAMSSFPGPAAATAGVAGVLADIMTEQGLRVPVRLMTAPAAEVIRARVHARRLALAAADGAVPAHVIGRRLAGLDPELALAAASDMARAIEKAREHLQALGPGADLGVDLDHDAVLARELLSVLARSGRFDRPRASDLAATLNGDLAEARMNSLDLVRGLRRLPADASGADLTGVDIGHLDPLDGVTWTRETTWPPGVRARILPHSEEVRPGVYQILVPYTGI